MSSTISTTYSPASSTTKGIDQGSFKGRMCHREACLSYPSVLRVRKHCTAGQCVGSFPKFDSHSPTKWMRFGMRIDLPRTINLTDDWR